MANALSIVLKSFGVTVTPEQVKAVEDLIPQLPAKVNEIVGIFNSALQNFDARLQAVEAQLVELRGENQVRQVSLETAVLDLNTEIVKNYLDSTKYLAMMNETLDKIKVSTNGKTKR